MDDTGNDELRIGFDTRLNLRFCGSKVTSGAGPLACRELDKALGLTSMGEDRRTAWLTELVGVNRGVRASHALRLGSKTTNGPQRLQPVIGERKTPKYATREEGQRLQWGPNWAWTASRTPHVGYPRL